MFDGRAVLALIVIVVILSFLGCLDQQRFARGGGGGGGRRRSAVAVGTRHPMVFRRIAESDLGRA